MSIDLNSKDPHPLDGKRRLVTSDLAPHVETIARRLLGEPNRDHSSKTQWRYGTNGSLAIELAGPERGQWYDHEHKVGGDTWSLLTVYRGMTPEAARDWLGEIGIKSEGGRGKRMIASYDYTDEIGELIFQVCRFEPKTFRQRKPDGHGGWSWKVKGTRLVPYHLPEILAATGRIYIVEGEKDADNLRRLGLVATCNPGGAGKWPPSFKEYFADRELVILPDNDDAGRDHARQVVTRLGRGEIPIVELPGLPDKGDVSDWIKAGGTKEQLEALVDAHLVKAPAQEIATSSKRSDNKRSERKVPDWTTRLSLYESGEPKPILDNCAVAFESDDAWRDVIWLDEFAQRVMMRRPAPWIKANGHWQPEPWNDAHTLEACRWIQQAGVHAATSIVHDAVMAVAYAKPYHPVRDYLEGLAWDRKPRLDTWLSYYASAEDSPYMRAIGARWMISAVARILQPGCKVDSMLILMGRQDIKKSMMFRILGDPWFSDDVAEIGSKDSAMGLAARWIIEFPELDSMYRSEVKRVKAFLTRTTDIFRPPYGRMVIERERQCVFGGTTNEFEIFKDETGNRRFWPVEVTSIDTDSLIRDRDQLWAEAVVRYKEGAAWHLFEPELIEDAGTRQAQHLQSDAWDELVMNYITNDLIYKRRVTIADILSNALNIERAKWSRFDQIRVAHILTRHGWEQKRDGKNGRFYVPIKNEPPAG